MYVKVPVSKSKKALIFYPDTFLNNNFQVQSLTPEQSSDNQKIINQYNALENDQKENVINNLKQKVDEYKLKINELESNFSKKTSEEKQFVMNNCNRKIQLLEKEKQELRNRNQLVLQQVDELKDLKTKHNQVLFNLKTNQDNLVDLQNELSQCKKDYLDTRNFDNDSIKQEFSQLLQNKENINNQKKILEFELKKAQEALNNSNGQHFEQFEKQKQEYSTLVNSYNNCLENSKQNQQEMISLQDKHEKVSKLLSEIESKYNTLLASKSNVDENINKLETIKKTLQDENARITSDLEGQLQLNKVQIENIKNLQNSVEKLSFDKEQHDKQLENLNKVLNNSQQELLKVELLLKDCQNGSSVSTNVLQSELDKQLELKGNLEQNLDNQTRKVGDLENLLQQCKSQSTENVSVVERELKIQQQKVKDLENKLKKFNEKLPETVLQQEQQVDNTKLNFVKHQQNIYNTLESTLQEKTNSNDDINTTDMEALSFIDNFKGLYTMSLNSNNTEQLYDEMYKLKDTLMNLYEDLQSAVRVYIRVKGGSSQQDNITIDNNLVTSKCQLNSSKYGPFFGVLPSSFNNKDIYTGCVGTSISQSGEILSHQVSDYQDQKCCVLSDTAGFCRVVDQLQSNYHIILLSYGHSGSGKTYTLFGNQQDPGLFQLSLANSGASGFKVEEIKELSVGDVDFRPNGQKYSKITRHILGKYSKKVANDYSNVQGVIELLQQINDIRISKKNVLATPNNPFSSRSHLFINLELYYPDGHTSKITFCDLGGRESPFELLRMFYEIPENTRDLQFASLLLPTTSIASSPYPRHVFTINDPLISWFTGTQIEKQAFVNDLNNVDIKLLLKQSLFINETLNHFEYFVKQNQKQSFNYTQIQEEKALISRTSKGITENTYNLQHFLVKKPMFDSNYKNNTNRSTTDPIKMYSLLTDLYTNSNLKTKLVMVCNVRPESKYCKVTNDTLEFANNIKST
jgi:hypothetical protein